MKLHLQVTPEKEDLLIKARLIICKKIAVMLDSGEISDKEFREVFKASAGEILTGLYDFRHSQLFIKFIKLKIEIVK